MPRRRSHITLTTLLTALLTCAAACQPHPLKRDSLLADEQLVGAPDTDLLKATHAHEPTKKPELALRRGALWYSIEAKPDSLLIHARLLQPASRTSFFLPQSWAGRDDYADHIRILGASSHQGARSLTLDRSQGRIDIDSLPDDPWIELRYEVKLHKRASTQQRFLPQRLGAGFFAYAPTFLILPSERVAQTLRDIPVELRAHSSQPPVSTWPLQRSATSTHDATLHVHGFIAPDILQLRDAFIALSDQLVAQREGPLHIVFERSFKAPREPIADAISLVLQHYQRSLGPLGDITVIVRAPDEGPMRWGTGRRAGFILELDPHASLDHDTAILIAHEAFHLWNGHLLIPSPDEEESTRWFKEGLTHYIALRTLGQLNLSMPRNMLHELAQAAQRYQDHPLTHRRDASPQQATLYPYDRGLLLALAIDDALQRSPSPQTCSIDSWLQHLLTLAKPRGGYYQQALLQRALEELPCDTTLARQRWHHLVLRSEPIHLTHLFESLGLHWLPAQHNRPARLIPIEGQSPRYTKLLSIHHGPP